MMYAYWPSPWRKLTTSKYHNILKYSFMYIPISIYTYNTDLLTLDIKL